MIKRSLQAIRLTRCLLCALNVTDLFHSPPPTLLVANGIHLHKTDNCNTRVRFLAVHKIPIVQLCCAFNIRITFLHNNNNEDKCSSKMKPVEGAAAVVRVKEEERRGGGGWRVEGGGYRYLKRLRLTSWLGQLARTNGSCGLRMIHTHTHTHTHPYTHM